MTTAPESDTPTPPRHRNYSRWIMSLLDWARTAVTAYSILVGNDTTSSTIKAILSQWREP